MAGPILKPQKTWFAELRALGPSPSPNRGRQRGRISRSSARNPMEANSAHVAAFYLLARPHPEAAQTLAGEAAGLQSDYAHDMASR
jgi:hypothetical protein